MEATQDEAGRAEQMQRRLTITAEVSRLLGESLELSSSLARVARYLVETMSRGCVIEVRGDDGLPVPAAVAHSDPAEESRLRQSFSRSRAAREPGTLMTPIEGAGGVVGSLILLGAPSDGGWGLEERELLSDIGRRIGCFVENAGLYEKARRAVSARDELLSIAAHELRTPLTAMMLHIQALGRSLRRQGREPFSIEAAVPKIDAAENQLDRLTRLIEALLDVSRIATHHLVLDVHRDVDLTKAVREVVAKLSRAAAREGSTITVIAERPVLGWWDPARLRQIVTNLVENAIKYGPGRPIEIAVRAVGPFAEVAVKDHGIGIAHEHLDQIFNRFERAVSAASYGGLGLGLYITKELVSAHDGTIHVTSEVGQGSEFVVTLPLRPAELDAELLDDAEEPADFDGLSQHS